MTFSEQDWTALAPEIQGMIRIAGGTFRMGSNLHYPEGGSMHRVTVDGFLIDRTPVTNRQFKEFVRATGYVTLAEISPDPTHYPGAVKEYPPSHTPGSFNLSKIEEQLEQVR